MKTSGSGSESEGKINVKPLVCLVVPYLQVLWVVCCWVMSLEDKHEWFIAIYLKNGHEKTLLLLGRDKIGLCEKSLVKNSIIILI